jgi:S-adenosylmethionine:tRNA ribosyltransferase-isomerase
VGPDAFDYELPAAQIAQAPASHRGDSRLLVATSPDLVHTHARALPQYLPPDALVVVNESGVVPARAFATRDDERPFELLLCAPGPGQGPGTEITAWVRAAKKLRVGDTLRLGTLALRYEGADDVDPRARRFTVVEGDVLSALRAEGQVPLPPYVRRAPDADDTLRYQTVYAAAPGSVAAPTAGLHLTEDQLAALDVVAVTLHVGPGTFLPMDVPDVAAHRVGHERVELTAVAATRIADAIAAGRPIVAVGTTTTRALEGIAATGGLRPFVGTTDLVITPGFQFRVVTHLLTNFHLPRSSLLMLVSSFAGHAATMSWYRTAVAAGYRFYSYGDCMLVRRADTP